MARRLLIYSEYHLSMLAGGERWILEVAPRLRDRYGWRVSILTTTLGHNPGNLSRIKDALQQHCVKYLAVEHSTLGLSQVYRAPKNLEILKDQAAKSDVVYWLDGFPRPLSDGVLKALVFRNQTPLVQGIHNPLFIPVARRPSHKLHNILNHLRLVNPIEKGNYYHAINRDDYRSLRMCGTKVFYAPNGVNTDFFIPSNGSPDEFTVLCIGSRWAKGSDFVPHVVRTVLERARKTCFVLVGGVAVFPALREQLERLKRRYPNNIKFIPSLAQEALNKLYSGCHLLLFPSRYEGFGIVALEAQSCGLPVLAFDIPGAPRDVVVDGVTGSLVKPYDLNAMAREVDRYRLLWEKDPDTYSGISTRARERALRFDWDDIAAMIDSHFSNIVDRSVDR